MSRARLEDRGAGLRVCSRGVSGKGAGVFALLRLWDGVPTAFHAKVSNGATTKAGGLGPTPGAGNAVHRCRHMARELHRESGNGHSAIAAINALTSYKRPGNPDFPDFVRSNSGGIGLEDHEIGQLSGA